MPSVMSATAARRLPAMTFSELLQDVIEGGRATFESEIAKVLGRLEARIGEVIAHFKILLQAAYARDSARPSAHAGGHRLATLSHRGHEESC